MVGTFYIYYLTCFYIEKFSLVKCLGCPEIHYGEVTACKEKRQTQRRQLCFTVSVPQVLVQEDGVTTGKEMCAPPTWGTQYFCLDNSELVDCWANHETVLPACSLILLLSFVPNSTLRAELHLRLLESSIDLARHWARSRLSINDWWLLTNSRWCIYII